MLVRQGFIWNICQGTKSDGNIIQMQERMDGCTDLHEVFVWQKYLT